MVGGLGNYLEHGTNLSGQIIKTFMGGPKIMASVARLKEISDSPMPAWNCLQLAI